MLTRRTLLTRLLPGIIVVPIATQVAVKAGLLSRIVAWFKPKPEPDLLSAFLAPMRRCYFPSNPILEMVAVQPMTRRHGEIFFTNYDKHPREKLPPLIPMDQEVLDDAVMQMLIS